MTKSRLPRVVWLLGFVSLCMDFSSEMIHALLPVFLISTLHASTMTLGLIEGLAEGTASIAKVFSGTLSDRLGLRKPLVVLGYGLAALSKPLFPLATTAGWVLGARLIDRIGKGIRGAPRDALVADITPREMRGAAYGLRQALDTAGALLGPLAAIGLMSAFQDDIRRVFWVAVIPAFLAVALLLVGVKEPPQHLDAHAPRKLPNWNDMLRLGTTFWLVVAIGAVFALARFSEAFLVLRAKDVGLSDGQTPLALAVMNVTYVASAYPVGRLSDRIGRTALLMIGLATLIVADLILAFEPHVLWTLFGIALWGLHMGLTQGLLAAMIADAAPADRRGAAFGVFYFVSGVAALAASLIAGGLWKWFGPSQTFLASATFSAIALGGAAWRSVNSSR